MQVGSLVICIKPKNGILHVNGIPVQLADTIDKDEILTVESMFLGKGERDPEVPSLRFIEKNCLIHPTTKRRVGYCEKSFCEIQPPMTIDISELQHQTEKV
jgi:hypothetical protein